MPQRPIRITEASTVKCVTADVVEFADDPTAGLAAPAWDDVKLLVWWQARRDWDSDWGDLLRNA